MTVKCSSTLNRSQKKVTTFRTILNVPRRTSHLKFQKVGDDEDKSVVVSLLMEVGTFVAEEERSSNASHLESEKKGPISTQRSFSFSLPVTEADLGWLLLLLLLLQRL